MENVLKAIAEKFDALKEDVDDHKLYTRFVDCRLVDSRFVYTLNTKTSHSWLTKPKTPKLNAKTGGLCPPEPP